MKRLRTPVAALLFSTMALWPSSIHADAANARLLPEDFAYVISAPDVPALWSALKTNPLAEGVAKLFKLPELVPQVEEIHRQLAAVEEGLGFKLNGDTLAAVAGALDLYARPGDRADTAAFGIAIRVTDEAKVAKLLDLLERAAMEAAGNRPDSTTSTLLNPITTAQYRELDIKTFDTERDTDISYARSGDMLLISTDKADLQAMLDRQLDAAAEGGLDKSERFAAVNKALGPEGHLFLYTNPKAANDMEASLDPDMRDMARTMDKLIPITVSAYAMTVTPERIHSRYHSIFDEENDPLGLRELCAKYPPTGPLPTLVYAPADSLIIVATNLVDFGTLLNAVKLVASAAGGPSSSEMDSTLEEFGTTLGFSVQGDLIPAFGHHFQFMLESIAITDSIPEVNAALVFSVADKARLEKVIKALEATASEAASSAGAAAEGADLIKTMAMDGAEVKYLEIPLPGGYSPCYTVDGEFLLLATRTDAMKTLLATRAGGQNLATSDAITSAGPGITPNAQVLTYVNVGKLIDIARSALRGRPDSEEVVAILDAFRNLGIYADSMTSQDNAIVGHGSQTFR